MLGKQEDLGLDSHTLCESHIDSVTICNLSPPDRRQEAEMREYLKLKAGGDGETAEQIKPLAVVAELQAWFSVPKSQEEVFRSGSRTRPQTPPQHPLELITAPASQSNCQMVSKHY